MSWLPYSDLISAGLGLMAAIALGVPALNAVRAKRYYETLQKLKANQVEGSANHAEFEKLSKKVEGLQLSGASEALTWNLVGYILLVLSFVMLAAAAIERHHSAAEHAQDNRSDRETG